MSQAKTRAVRAGQLAPTFRLRELGGSSVALIDLVAEGPLVLSFYRGSWCDFCETALERLSAIDGDIRALGAQQVVIGPPPANEVQANRLTGLAMTVLADAGLDVTTAYGLTVGLPREDHGRYLELGFKPAGLSDRTKWFVSIPATYVVDRLGRVVMAAIDTDYRNRLEGREILSALRALRERSGG
jgi:peroxiredoxin